MNDIAVTLIYRNYHFVATLRFNKIKVTSTIKDMCIEIFCEKLAKELRSTLDKKPPLARKSSATISQFDSTSLFIDYDSAYPIQSEHIKLIQSTLSDFINEKEELAKLFAESQIS